tara:strand:- start:1142 stop:1909 length:768 start_codon:yes stop_codon:yes gene_type:complete
MNDTGILYFFDHERYFNHAIKSIKVLRRVCDLPITVFCSCTDQDLYEITEATQNYNYRDVTFIKVRDNPHLKTYGRYDSIDNFHDGLHWTTKVSALQNLPYQTTVFLDSDTFFLKDPTPLISKSYDVAGCRECVYPEEGTTRSPGAKAVWQSFNTGFIIFNKSLRLKKFLNLLGYKFKEASKNLQQNMGKQTCNDQSCFNHAIEQSIDITYQVLPSKWNVRDPIYDLIDDPAMIHTQNFDSDYFKKFFPGGYDVI